MKRIFSCALPMVLIVAFAATGLAQQTTKHLEKKQPAAPAHTESKATIAQNNSMTGTAAVQLNKDEIIALQTALIEAKAYKGMANGMLDAATKSAIRKYQTDNKLKVTGEPNQETLHHLGVAFTATPDKSAATQHAVMKKDTGKKSQPQNKKSQ